MKLVLCVEIKGGALQEWVEGEFRSIHHLENDNGYFHHPLSMCPSPRTGERQHITGSPLAAQPTAVVFNHTSVRIIPTAFNNHRFSTILPTLERFEALFSLIYTQLIAVLIRDSFRRLRKNPNHHLSSLWLSSPAVTALPLQT